MKFLGNEMTNMKNIFVKKKEKKIGLNYLTLIKKHLFIIRTKPSSNNKNKIQFNLIQIHI